MTLEEIRSMLAWCTIMNGAFLLLWWVLIMFCRDFIYRIHAKWFKFNEQTFDVVHYSGMGLLKVAILFFNLVPYIALRIIG